MRIREWYTESMVSGLLQTQYSELM